MKVNINGLEIETEKQMCNECSTEKMCPQCHCSNFNEPIGIKYINDIMPIIISTCCLCHVELFRSMTYECTTLHKNFCLTCASKLEDEAYKYRELS